MLQTHGEMGNNLLLVVWLALRLKPTKIVENFWMADFEKEERRGKGKKEGSEGKKYMKLYMYT